MDEEKPIDTLNDIEAVVENSSNVNIEPTIIPPISEPEPVSDAAPEPVTETTPEITLPPEPDTTPAIQEPVIVEPPVIQSVPEVINTPEPAAVPTATTESKQSARVIEEPVSTTTPSKQEPKVSDIKPEILVTTEPSTAETPVTTDPSPITEIFDVSSLSKDQLKQASILYARLNQAENSRKGVEKRQQNMEHKLKEIVDYLSHDNGSPLPRIAKHTGTTPSTTSKYLRQLIGRGKITASGWSKTRRYFLK